MIGVEHEKGTPYLNGAVDHRKCKSMVSKRVRQGDSQQDTPKHQEKEHQPYWILLGIEKVCNPGRVNPDPPDRKNEQRRLDKGCGAEVASKCLCELDQSEHKNE